MQDDGDPHYAIPTCTDPSMIRLRGNVVQGFERLVNAAGDTELDDVTRALDQLRQRDRRVYQSLMGCTLLNDIIRSVYEEHQYRNRQAAQGERA